MNPVSSHHVDAMLEGLSMKRIRDNEDGTTSEFYLKIFGQNGPIRAEIVVDNVAELRALKKEGKLISVRMEGPPNPGRTQKQVNLVPWGEIEDFDWDA